MPAALAASQEDQAPFRDGKPQLRRSVPVKVEKPALHDGITADQVPDFKIVDVVAIDVKVAPKPARPPPPPPSKAKIEGKRTAITDVVSFAADRLDGVGLGWNQPFAPNDTKEGRARNQRVDFVITNQSRGIARLGGRLPRGSAASLSC